MRPCISERCSRVAAFRFAMSEGSKAWVHWGEFHPATLSSTEAGLYGVRYLSDGLERWVPACELCVDEPLPAAVNVPLQHELLVPNEIADTYTRATLVGCKKEAWTVRLDDGSGVERQVARSAVRLPMTTAALIGAGSSPLTTGDAVHTLRGRWVSCILLSSNSSSSSSSSSASRAKSAPALSRRIKVAPTGASSSVEVNRIESNRIESN